MRKVSEIIIHCSATPNGRYHTVDDIDRWHKERGWRMVGYHWVIRTDGTIDKGRDERDIGSHVAGHNTRSIGICMIGMDKFTPAQWASLAVLVNEIASRHPQAVVVGHGDIPGVQKTCPGFSGAEWAAHDYAAPLEHVLA